MMEPQFKIRYKMVGSMGVGEDSFLLKKNLTLSQALKFSEILKMTWRSVTIEPYEV